jgi:hypothetical protein
MIRLVGGGRAHLAEFTLLFGDLLPDVVRRITPGSVLFIMEGGRTVGECEVLSVRGPLTNVKQA